MLMAVKRGKREVGWFSGGFWVRLIKKQLAQKIEDRVT
jgi:hypothetical protein